MPAPSQHSAIDITGSKLWEHSAKAGAWPPAIFNRRLQKLHAAPQTLATVKKMMLKGGLQKD